MIKPNSEKCHIKRRPTTSDSMRPTSHNLQRRTKHSAVAYTDSRTI